MDTIQYVMHLSELRFGNFVLIENEKHHPEIKNIPMVVKSISRNYWQGEGYFYYCELDKLIPEKYDLKNYSQKIEFLKPIILTEEYLLKFGFTKINDHFENENCWVYILKNYFEFEHIFSKLKNSESDGRVNMHKYYKYVHELQNLYFTINSIELVYSA